MPQVAITSYSQTIRRDRDLAVRQRNKPKVQTKINSRGAEQREESPGGGEANKAKLSKH